TLLRCVNGLEQPDGGEILLDGRPISAGNLVQVRRQIGMVFQSYDLFPHMDVLENLTLGPTTTMTSPSRTDREMPSSTPLPSKLFFRFRISRTFPMSRLRFCQLHLFSSHPAASDMGQQAKKYRKNTAP
ncbi:MAG: amino acid ABC transporter ATP-binding protein, partial [Clostridia bacterium]|nr:amino acid ABC transporter ATP-binding protein [Clostridia bacterium]